MNTIGFTDRLLDNGRHLYYKVLDGRTIEVLSDVAYINETIEGKPYNREITSLDFGGVLKITKEFDFETGILGKKSTYHITCIERLQDNPKRYALLTHKRNKSSIYLLPILGQNKEFFSFTGRYDYFINCYLTEDLQYLNLLYRYFSHDSYNHMEFRLTQHPKFCKHYEVGPNHVIMQFKPNNLEIDAKEFLNGKYSKLTIQLKEKIVTFNDFNIEHHVVHILRKSEELRQRLSEFYDIKFSETDELESKPIYEEEVWKL